ncbi:MAG: hypothetical protein ACRC3Y_03650 [Romboutsia sp.]|uniref:hypothetical protein n=1 Tax=Romboutsia sp. TaxID=1965302 RepID=UPI003F357846
MKTIEELEQEIQELYKKANEMKEELQEVEHDPELTQKEKDCRCQPIIVPNFS